MTSSCRASPPIKATFSPVSMTTITSSLPLSDASYAFACQSVTCIKKITAMICRDFLNRLFSCMPETAFPSTRFRKTCHNLQLNRRHFLKDELSNSITPIYDKRFVTMVYQNHFDFSAIISIDGAGSIQYGDAEFPC